MTVNANGKVSLKDEFRSLSTKQLIGIFVAIAVSLVLEVLGLGTMCLGFLIIAVVLYMVPHLLGVMSVRIKAIIGVVFVILALLIGTFAYTGASDMYEDASKDDGSNDKVIKDMTYSNGSFEVTILETVYEPTVGYSEIINITFGAPRMNVELTEFELSPVESESGRYSAEFDLDEGKLYYIQVTYKETDAEDAKESGRGFYIDTGISSSDEMMLCFMGSGITTAFVAVLFFMILIFSALMRKFVGNTRDRMEAEGRLYPQGYGRCKECGAMVLPGEINCRKCGAYIDVPDELRAKKKDFFQCSECGAEVPNDASECPRCGARFDSVETEITHVDGTVDVSSETFECSECGAEVPSNATRCPKCGAKFDEDD